MFLTQEASVLKHTTSRCPVCHAPCPAQVVKRAGKVWMERTCAVHGEFTACLASDERFYWLALGKEENRAGGCGGGACCSAKGEAAGTVDGMRRDTATNPSRRSPPVWR